MKVRGNAREEPDTDLKKAVCTAIGEVLAFEPRSDLVGLFTVDIVDVCLIRYVTGDQHVLRWPAREAFVRSETSATSVGSPHDRRSF